MCENIYIKILCTLFILLLHYPLVFPSLQLVHSLTTSDDRVHSQLMVIMHSTRRGQLVSVGDLCKGEIPVITEEEAVAASFCPHCWSNNL